MTRQTVNVNGTAWCADLSGSLPGTMTIANATLGACTTPPPGGGDTDAVTSAQVFYGGDSGGVITLDPRDLGNIMGRIGLHDPIAPYPFRSPSVEIPIPAGKHLRMRFAPSALGLYRMLKGVSYQRVRDPGRLYRFTITTADGSFDSPISSAAYLRSRALDDRPLFYITSDGSTNSMRVNTSPSVAYDLLIAPENGASAVVALAWQP